jgi:hypothetical protein
MDDPVDPVAARKLIERRELLRAASQRALDLHAQIGHLDAESLSAARHYAGFEPVNILTSGE